ncbi:hypothetical protein ACFQH8_21990 [Halomicroarcula sp. GCM10025710]
MPEDAGRNTPPADTGTATPTLSTSPPNGRALGGTAPPRDYWAGITADEQGRRYSAAIPRPRTDLRAPAGQVVHIQVAALGNNDPTTDEDSTPPGASSPSHHRQSFGSYTGFTDTFIVQYRPLFTARAVAYGPLTLDGDVATQRVSVLGRMARRRAHLARREPDRGRLRGVLDDDGRGSSDESVARPRAALSSPLPLTRRRPPVDDVGLRLLVGVRLPDESQRRLAQVQMLAGPDTAELAGVD